MPTEITTQTRQMSGSSAGETQKNQHVVIEPNRAVTRQTSSTKEQDLPPARESSLPPEEKLDSAATEMNKYVQNMQRDLHFSVDEDSGETVIKVVESQSQRLIRTIPSEEFLSISREFNQGVGLLLKARA